ALLELCLLVLARGLESTLEVVEHRQQLLQHPLRREPDELRLVALDALAVVLELGLQTPERVEILVALPPRLLERGRLRPLLGLRPLERLLFDVVCHYGVLASSSTTS